MTVLEPTPEPRGDHERCSGYDEVLEVRCDLKKGHQHHHQHDHPDGPIRWADPPVAKLTLATALDRAKAKRGSRPR